MFIVRLSTLTDLFCICLYQSWHLSISLSLTLSLSRAIFRPVCRSIWLCSWRYRYIWFNKKTFPHTWLTVTESFIQSFVIFRFHKGRIIWKASCKRLKIAEHCLFFFYFIRFKHFYILQRTVYFSKFCNLEKVAE